MAAAVDPATHALVHDLRPAFADGLARHARPRVGHGAGCRDRGVHPRRSGGKVVVIAPPPDDADPAAAGVRAAAENLARTLSIEWARHGITTVAITPGPDTTDAQLAALAAYPRLARRRLLLRRAPRARRDGAHSVTRSHTSLRPGTS